MGLLFLAAADGCRPNETVERQADDAGIKTSIKAKLAADVRFSTLTAVSVDVTNGIVTLAGPVHSEDEKQKIEETVPADRKRLADEANSALKQAITDQGLSVEEYGSILVMAQNDPTIREKILQRVLQRIQPSAK